MEDGFQYDGVQLLTSVIKDVKMRWKSKNEVDEVGGTKRIITRFLFFPRKIKSETRWLEWVRIEQEYVSEPGYGGFWKNVRWCN